jgi:GntR family transcriptional regulator
MTARHAVSVLEREGYVYRRPTRGTFVAEPRISVQIGGFTDELGRVGRTPGAKLLHTEVSVPTPLTAEALDLEAGEKVLITQRLRSADGQPLALETSYWPQGRFSDLLDQVGEGSLWQLLRERYGVVATETEARMEAISLDDASCVELGVSRGAPGFMLTRRTFDQERRCFEFARDLYRGDRSEFRIKVRVEDEEANPTLLAPITDERR